MILLRAYFYDYDGESRKCSQHTVKPHEHHSQVTVSGMLGIHLCHKNAPHAERDEYVQTF